MKRIQNEFKLENTKEGSLKLGHNNTMYLICLIFLNFNKDIETYIVWSLMILMGFSYLQCT